MLDCCHCLCGRERSASKRLDQCYPTDNRSSPVLSHVRELINWGTHDIARFETIYDLLTDRINGDVSHGKANPTFVGVKILSKILEDVQEINLNISNILVNVTVQLIRTRNTKFLDIADFATNTLIQYAQKIKLRDYVANIVKAYLKLLNNAQTAERVYVTLSKMIDQTTVNVVPVNDILTEIKDKIASTSGARDVVVSIAHSVNVVMIPQFTDILIKFFNEQNIWNDVELSQEIIGIMIAEMKEKCAPAFFKIWLEQLPPRSPDNGHCKEIINVALQIIENLPQERLFNQTEPDSLMTVFYFILKIKDLDYKDKKALEDAAFKLGKAIASYYSDTEIFQIIHHQLWISLPAGEENSTDYDVKQVEIIFKFAQIYDKLISTKIDKKAIKDCLKRILSFLLYFQNHHTEIFMVVLKYLKSLEKISPSCKIDSVVPMLLALQKDAKKKKKNAQLTIQTFIMCAMTDALNDSPPTVLKYCKKIIKSNLEANPPACDYDAPFFKKYFPKFKKPKKASKPEKAVIVYFKKKNLMDKFEDLKNRSSLFRLITDLGTVDFDEDEVEEEEVVESDGEDEIKLVYHSSDSDEESVNTKAGKEDTKESKEEREAKRKQAFKLIDKTEFKWKSNLTTLNA